MSLRLGNDTVHRHKSNRGAFLYEAYSNSLMRVVAKGQTMPNTCRLKQTTGRLTFYIAVLLIVFGPHARAATGRHKPVVAPAPVTHPNPSPIYFDFKGARLCPPANTRIAPLQRQCRHPGQTGSPGRIYLRFPRDMLQPAAPESRGRPLSRRLGFARFRDTPQPSWVRSPLQPPL